MKRKMISKLIAFGMTLSMLMGSVQPVMAEEVEDKCANGHVLSEWARENADCHYRGCKVCWREETLEFENHTYVNGVCEACGDVNADARNEYLAQFRDPAIQALEEAAGEYEVKGDELDRVVSEAKNQINLADDEEAIEQIKNDFLAKIPEAALWDAKFDAFDKIEEVINSKPRSEEFQYCAQEWANEIYECQDIESVKAALAAIIDEKIPACEEEFGYVDPMSQVYGKIAGTYEMDEDPEILYIVGMDENNNYQILYGVEGDLEAIEYFDVDDEDGIITVYASSATLIFDGDTLTEKTGRPSRPTLISFTKVSGGKPVGEAPVCPECKNTMILVETHEEGCTWECDTAGCKGVITAKNHVDSEICICTESCIHTFDGAVCTKCSYVSTKRELEIEKAAFEEYKDQAAMVADSYKSDDDSAAVTQLIKDAKAAIKAVTFDKDSAEEKKTEIESILSDLELAIAAQKEAEKEAELCMTIKTTAPKAGTFELYLNGVSAGYYSLTPASGGWALSNSNGYLTLENGALTYVDVPVAWGYKNGAFFRTVETRQSGILGWFGITKTTTYYLASATTVSTKVVKTELKETVFASTHTYTAWVDQKDGTHTRRCTACDEIETGSCQYDEETGYCECGAYNPALVDVTIKATVEKVTEKYLIFFTKTSYRATIKTEAKGTTIKKVEYSTDGGKTWKSGSSFTSSRAIEGFLVRVTDAKGNVYNYTYPEDSEVVEFIDR